MRIKKSKLISLFGLLLLFSCSTSEIVKLQIDVPQEAAIDLENFDEMAITNFLVKEKPEGFEINKELTAYFSAEFAQHLDKKISYKHIPLDNEENFEDEAFWKNFYHHQQPPLLFTGRVNYKAETRKAIKSTGKKRFEDPFPEESRIYERKFYSLDIDVYLINSQTGKTLFKKSFKENKSYSNKNQSADFAFYDLIQAVKEKLFRQLVGESRVQERYLIK
jgi:hypothetical protein